MGTESGVLQKNAFFPPRFFGRFWPRVGVFSCFLVFFLFFHGGIRYKRILWYQGSIVFLNIFGICCFSDVFW